MMIELKNQGKRVLVNPDHIVAVIEGAKGTKLLLTHQFEVTIEEPYEVIKIMLEAKE